MHENALSDATADQALFIHDSRIAEGSGAPPPATALANENKPNDEVLASAVGKTTKTRRPKHRLPRVDGIEDERASSSSANGSSAEAAKRSFTGDVTRGSLCAFIAGRASELDQWIVTVASIQQFAPGIRVAVAAEDDALNAYER